MAIGPWLRRGTAGLVFFTMAAFLLWNVWQNPFWRFDATWGARYMGAVSALFAPLVAAAAAFDVATRQAPTLTDLCRMTPRGRRGAAGPALAVLVAVLAAFGVAIAAVLVVVHRADGLTQLDPWIGPELVLAYGAAVAVGAAVGATVPGLVAPIVAALGVLAAPIVAAMASVGVANALFNIGHSEGTSLGLQRVPGAAVAAMATHAAVIAACAVVVRWSLRNAEWRRGWWVPAVGAIAATLAVQGLTFPPGGTFEASHDPQVCVGSAPVVCGPERGRRFLAMAAEDHARAYRALATSGLRLPDRLVYDRSDHHGWSKNSSNLSFNLEDIVDGHLPSSTVIRNLVMPRPCAGLFGTGDSALMERQSRVGEWLEGALRRSTSGPAPASVKADYESLLTCRTAFPE